MLIILTVTSNLIIISHFLIAHFSGNLPTPISSCVKRHCFINKKVEDMHVHFCPIVNLVSVLRLLVFLMLSVSWMLFPRQVINCFGWWHGQNTRYSAIGNVHCRLIFVSE